MLWTQLLLSLFGELFIGGRGFAVHTHNIDDDIHFSAAGKRSEDGGFPRLIGHCSR